MGSSSKKSRDKESKKRRHHNRDDIPLEEVRREKKHKHHRHHHHRKSHKDRKRIKRHRSGYESGDSDVVEIIAEPTLVPTPPPPHIERDASPEVSGTYHESLSVEETNKIRAKLGLKPLQVDSGRLDIPKKDDGKKKDDWGEFYHRPADSITNKIKQDKIRSRLSDHKEKRNVESKLSNVNLLNEVVGEDDDAAAWVKKSRKISSAKLEAEKRAKMLEEMDAQFGIGEVVESQQQYKRAKQYSETNLRGLQVQHNIDTFKEGHTVVLTLKDQGVLDEDDDTLVNVNMLDNERYLKSNENKKKKSVYSSYDYEDEIDEFGEFKPKSLLGKYDEEIDGAKCESFRIGYDNAIERKQARIQSIKERLANKLVDTVATSNLMLASDYYNEQEMARFKKPKRVRKMRVKGKLTADDLERAGQLNTDYDDTVALSLNTKFEIKMEDDNEDLLERALHKTRKIKQKEALTLPELKLEPDDEATDTGNIILNATAEFCRTLGDIPTYGKSGNREDSENLLHLQKDEYKDEPMDIEDSEEIDEGGRWNAVDPNYVVKQHSPPTAIETPILEEEPDLTSGVGAALKLAMSKGYLDKEEKNRPSNSRLAYLQAQHYSIEDKNYNDDTERNAGGGANRRERFAGPIVDFKEKNTYKPNVKLEYIDDEGHVLNAKEAFRYLSHKFHGKGPGKNKVEKRLQKVVQEGLMKKMSSTDTPLGTLNMLQSKQKEMQSPYIVLSGGKHTHSTTISKARR